MKKAELNNLKFKDFLQVVYEDLEPYLITELNRLRTELISLPENTSEKELLSTFENSVKKLNRIDQDDNIKSGIDTEEREGLCEALLKMRVIVGLKEEEKGECFDKWREW